MGPEDALDAFHLAHISDLHVLNLHGTKPWRLLNKRLTGLGNLLGPRRGAHPAWLAAALVARLDDPNIHHIAMTGDLTNLALPSEFSAGVQLLTQLGDGARLSAIPGNHDVYTAGSARCDRADHSLAPWNCATIGRASYPFVKAPRPWMRIYGLSSAIAAPPMFAWGEVGQAQLARLRTAIASEPPEVRQRVVLVHHNVHRRGKLTEPLSRLRDADALLQTLVDLNVNVLLHGHTHQPHRSVLQRDGKSMWILGCGSSTWHRPAHGEFAHFNVLRLQPAGLQSIQTEVWSDGERRFVIEERDALPTTAARAVRL